MWEMVKAIFYNLLYPIWIFIKWVIAGLFDVFCSLIEFMFSLISIPENLATGLFNWADLPQSVLYILHQLAIPTCSAMLVSAIGVRVALNFIPSWATRV